MQWPSPLTWFTLNKKFRPKNFLQLPEKSNFSNEKIFYVRSKEPIARHTHLVHPKKKFLPKDFLILTRKNQFFPLEEKFLLFFRRNFQHLSKKSKFSKTNTISQTKNFLYLSKKLISYTCAKKLKPFILDVFWIRLC